MEMNNLIKITSGGLYVSICDQSLDRNTSVPMAFISTDSNP